MPDAPTLLPTLRGLIENDAPLAPIHAATHARLTEVEHGRCEARMPTIVGDGLMESVLILADFGLGLAYSATLPSDRRTVTVRLGVELLARPRAGDELVVSARLDESRAGVGLSSATVSDRGGTLVARAMGRNVAVTDAPTAECDAPPPTWSTRPTSWRLLMPHRGEDPTRDGTTLVAHPDPTSVNAAGVVQGGALAGLAARGLSQALEVLPEDFSVVFVRPVRPHRRVLCRVVVEHRGRRLRVGRAELVDDDGRLLATASGTSFRP